MSQSNIENRRLHNVRSLLDLAMALQDAVSGPTAECAVWKLLLTRKRPEAGRGTILKVSRTEMGIAANGE